MDWGAISIDAAGLDCEDLLSEWRWLVPAGLRPISLTLFGDWFLEAADGRVLFLDTIGGQLLEIAPTRAAFLAAREEPQNRDQWYMADLALLCLERGLKPGAGECLSFTIPPVLNGRLDADNIDVCHLVVHQSVTAQIHRQLKDLPPGTPINRILVDGEEP